MKIEKKVDKKWILIGFFSILILALFLFYFDDVKGFFIFAAFVVGGSLLVWVTTNHYGKSLIGFAIILFLFFFGIWISQKVKEVKASNDARSLEIVGVVQAKTIETVEIVEEASSVATCTDLPQRISQWCFLIEKGAEDYSLDPLLIAAVMTQESQGDPNAYSECGAVGLMQVMPCDGLSYTLYGDYFSDRDTMAVLFNPPYNVNWGAEHLAQRIATYGSVREGVKHYGPACNYEIDPDCNPDKYVDLVMQIYEEYKSINK